MDGFGLAADIRLISTSESDPELTFSMPRARAFTSARTAADALGKRWQAATQERPERRRTSLRQRPRRVVHSSCDGRQRRAAGIVPDIIDAESESSRLPSLRFSRQ